MPDLPSREDYFTIGANEVLARSLARTRNQISRKAIYTPGTDVNIALAWCSAMADEATRHLAIRQAALFLDSAEGEDLDRLVADRVSPTVVRKDASAAVVTLTFARAIPPSPGLGGSIPQGTQFQASNGQVYELIDVVGIPAGGTGPYYGTASAIQAGPDGNANAGTITQFVTGPFDPLLTVTNAQDAAGGNSQETDASLRNRARAFYTAIRGGTAPAIEFGALTVPGVSYTQVIEEVDVNGEPTGVVSLIIADGEGRANAALGTAVQAALRDYRAAGIVVRIIPSYPQYVDISYALVFDLSLDVQTTIAQIKTLTLSAVNNLGPGDTLRTSLLASVARSVRGVTVPSSGIAIPTADVVPSDGRSLRTTIERILVNGV